MSWNSDEPKSSYGIELEKAARRAEREEAKRKRAEEGKKTYTARDLVSQYRVDEATGCWLWTGEFRRYGDGQREMPIMRGIGKHEMCGIPHNAMSRVIYEEHLGRRLKTTENVAGTCASNRGDRHACVNPEHHELRRGAGIMFAHEMVE